MAVANYVVRHNRINRIHEKDNTSPYQTNEPSRSEMTIEEEIRLLREKMEQIFLQEESFVSELVMEVSKLLDAKINLYMRSTKNTDHE